MIAVKVFFIFFKIGLFAFGGAYSFLPLLEKELVEGLGWLTKDEFLDLLGMIRVTPGALSVKFATYTGYKIAGIPGVLAANLGNLLAPVLIMMLLWLIYQKYKDIPRVKSAFTMIHLAIFSMIIAVAFRLVDLEQLVRFKSILVVLVTFALFLYTKIHPAAIIVGAGIVGALMAP